MPNISPLYIQIAENTINSLHVKCKRGIYAERLFKTIFNGSNKYYSLQKIEWMKEYLQHDNQHIATSCLDCLCSKGLKLDDIYDILQKRIKDRLFSLKAIDIAEKENNPNVLLLYMEEEDYYINRIILALKKTNNESYLTTLMLSDNEKLVQTINKITNNKK